MSLKHLKPIKLYSWATPNGVKVSTFLEELRLKYELPFETTEMKLGTNVQKEPWFLAINPNGRIPAIVDPNQGDFAVFETAAIISYLAQTYDAEKEFTFDPRTDPLNYSEMMQWVFFTHGGIGPMQGQATYFARSAQEKIPFAIKRYHDEVRRLYGVLQIRLGAGRDYLAGPGRGKYSEADVNTWGWLRIHGWGGIAELDEWPAVKAWNERVSARPAAKTGPTIPVDLDLINKARQQPV